ncbi:MAG: fumarate hydratase C-terminal domain-containing protein [bacterium]
MVKLNTPINEEARLSLRAGDRVTITGTIYTGRDAAHQLMVQTARDMGSLPFDFTGALIYYTGPTPAQPGMPIGACGPTSSYRMDKFSLELMPLGLKIMLGKGPRGKEFRAALVANGAVYLVVTGGIGALLSQRVRAAQVIAYEHLGAEAVYRLEVVDFPATVAYDALGNEIFADHQD